MSKPKQQYSGGMSNLTIASSSSDATFSNPSQSPQAKNKGKKVIRDDRFDAM